MKPSLKPNLKKQRFGMNKIQWEPLTELKQLTDIKQNSADTHVLIFKYSSRCSISDMALSRLNRSWDSTEMLTVKPYFLDLITYRDISDQIAEQFLQALKRFFLIQSHQTGIAHHVESQNGGKFALQRIPPTESVKRSCLTVGNPDI